MGEEYDFSAGRRGAVIPSPSQSRASLMLDDDLVEHFRKAAESPGAGDQALIDAIPRAHFERIVAAGDDDQPVTVAALRRVLRGELPQRQSQRDSEREPAQVRTPVRPLCIRM